jgi:hypothetical protein
MISRYSFSTVLMPLSAVDGSNAQKSFERRLCRWLSGRAGIIAMKALSAGQLLMKKAASLEECLRYVWGLPVSTTILGMESLVHVDSNVSWRKALGL